MTKSGVILNGRERYATSLRRAPSTFLALNSPCDERD